jgi:hypothetical protein
VRRLTVLEKLLQINRCQLHSAVATTANEKFSERFSRCFPNKTGRVKLAKTS